MLTSNAPPKDREKGKNMKWSRTHDHLNLTYMVEATREGLIILGGYLREVWSKIALNSNLYGLRINVKINIRATRNGIGTLNK